MCDDGAETFIAFNREREESFNRWSRLVRALANYTLPGWGDPQSTLELFDKYFVLLESPRDAPSPRPGSLTPEQLDEIAQRDQAAFEAMNDLNEELRPCKE